MSWHNYILSPKIISNIETYTFRKDFRQMILLTGILHMMVLSLKEVY